MYTNLSMYIIVVLFLHHHEQGIIVHYYNKGMIGAMHGLMSIVKAFLLAQQVRSRSMESNVDV